jgi:hypothetical protein
MVILYIQNLRQRYLIKLDPLGRPPGPLVRDILKDTLGRSNIFFTELYPWPQSGKVKITPLRPGRHAGQEVSVMAGMAVPNGSVRSRVGFRS